jgi:glutaredoxin 3
LAWINEIMPPIEIYTTPYCPYCIAAKELLGKKGAVFKEIDVSGNRELRAQMTERSNGGYTVPQIFIGATHVGGCDDLYALEEEGKLDPLLNSGATA